jgi:hypothetical protein
MTLWWGLPIGPVSIGLLLSILWGFIRDSRRGSGTSNKDKQG